MRLQLRRSIFVSTCTSQKNKNPTQGFDASQSQALRALQTTVLLHTTHQFGFTILLRNPTFIFRLNNPPLARFHHCNSFLHSPRYLRPHNHILHLTHDHPNTANMAPKGKQTEPKKAKASVDDKTFGMKNKKGGSAQRQIKQLQAMSKSNVTPEEKRKLAEKEQREKDKAAAEKAKAEAAELFKPVQVQKVPFGVDPKTVLCQFFKQGHCEKGKKCKFSHDLDIIKKTAKRDLYQDTRENEKEEKEKDNMEEWDEEKLRNVVKSKHGNPQTTTDKVCKYFISAVEDGKYGWFWTCPNGGDKCMYRHSLPAGYVALIARLWELYANSTTVSCSRPRNNELRRRH